MTSNNQTRKNGPIKTVKVNPEQISEAATAASQPGELQALLASRAIVFDMAAIAPQRGKGTGGTTAKATAVAIDWPQEIRQLAEALNVSLLETEPVRGRCGSGLLLVDPKGSRLVGQPIPEPSQVGRNDAAAVWSAWLAHGAAGQLPSMAAGESLPVLGLLKALAGAPASMQAQTACRRLWAGSGSRTSVMGILAAHTGRTVRLTLDGFAVTLH